MPTRQLQDITFIRNSTALGGIEGIIGGVIQTAINYTTTANDYIVVATALDLTITIGKVSQNTGQWIIVKDGTGKASRANPLRIIAENDPPPGPFGFDNNAFNQLFITSPNAGIAMFVDPTSSQIFTAPWNPVLDGTLATTTYIDYDGSTTPGDIILRTLPPGPTEPDLISIHIDPATLIPFITSDEAASMATMSFSHRFYNGRDQILTLPATDTLTITNGTNSYFTTDGLIDLNENYERFGSFGQLRITVEGNAVGSTPLTLAIVDIDSRGFQAAGIPLFACTVKDRSIAFIELD
jgi:hypothetical protein